MVSTAVIQLDITIDYLPIFSKPNKRNKKVQHILHVSMILFNSISHYFDLDLTYSFRSQIFYRSIPF